MTLPLVRWMTRKLWRSAGHLGPAASAPDALWLSANGSRLPSARQMRSRAAELCSTSSSTAGGQGREWGCVRSGTHAVVAAAPPPARTRRLLPLREEVQGLQVLVVRRVALAVAARKAV